MFYSCKNKTLFVKLASIIGHLNAVDLEVLHYLMITI